MNGKVWTRAFCLMTAALFVLIALPVKGESFPYTAYATDSVRLRGGPSSSAAILTVIKKGDAVTVTGADGKYKIVEYENRKGYVIETFLSTGTADESAAAVDPETAKKYPALTKGSSGDKVKALQEALKELGFYTKKIDSKYGSGTSLAVEKFQEKNKLTKNGIADGNTQALLFEGQPLNSRGIKTTARTLPSIEGVTIRPGDQGDAVRAVQQILTDLKLYSGNLDGKYGAKTQDAVKAFQKANNLKADGVIGAKTYAALNASRQAATPTQAPVIEETSNVYVAPELPEATYPYQTTAASAVNLRKRASSSAMRILTIPQGETIEVLEEQGSYLKVIYRKYTGYVQKDFINIPEQYLEGKSLKSDQAARVSYETLVSGAEGKKVRALQQALTELGFYSGKIDGKFGAGTSTALKAMQTKNGLRATGIALPELQQLIYEKRVRNAKNRLVSVKTLPPIDGVTMQQGDYGDAVYELHQMLMQAKLFDSNIGYEFTSATTKAVKAFQKEHSIKVTGKVDSFTLLAIRTAVGAKPTANEQAAKEELTQENVVIISNGTRGLAVSRLQQRLVELKYYNIKPDGEYNNDDIMAVQHFQRLNNLPVTGIADLATQQVLYTAYAIGADASVNDTSGAASGLLKIGSQGELVRALQSRLIALNFLSGSIDGNFGTQTAAAVAAFQKANNLKQDGIVGSQTTNVLYSVNAKGNQTAAKPAGTAPSVSETLKVGSSGDQVRAVQQRLISLAYLSGAADGIYGPRTALAVSEFQAKNKLAADGIAGKMTIAALNSANAIAKNVTVQAAPAPAPTQPAYTPTQTFVAPKASEVRYANWYSEIRPMASSLRNVIIYDFISGAHYNFRFFSLGKHADGAPLTAKDTAAMNKAFGAKNWTPRPVWVIFSNGKVYMASTHTHPHANDYVSGNDLNGHLCVHFPRVMEEAALTGPYAVSHQNAILAGWDLTKNMAR
ncbi:MAG: peptidoglycan-binding protein [Bacillota bacterium]|nr:peptidoglycan-binding protein [Bacillota bacterium]